MALGLLLVPAWKQETVQLSTSDQSKSLAATSCWLVFGSCWFYAELKSQRTGRQLCCHGAPMESPDLNSSATEVDSSQWKGLSAGY